MKKGARSLPRRVRPREGGDSQASLLSAEQSHRISRAISDRTRCDILRRVFESGGLTCGAEGLSISAATASHHIRKLFESVVVDMMRRGQEFRRLQSTIGPPRSE